MSYIIFLITLSAALAPKNKGRKKRRQAPPGTAYEEKSPALYTQDEAFQTSSFTTYCCILSYEFSVT